MPAKKKTSKHASNIIVLIKRTLTVLVPVFALLAGIGILQTSLSRNTSDTILNAETSQSFFYSFDAQVKIAQYKGQQIAIPVELNKSIAQTKTSPVLGESTGGEKWIEIDLSDQKLIAHDGDQVFLETAISTGLPGTPTPTGEFNIWYKIKSTKMSGGEGRSYYYLPNVPFVMFFENTQVPGFKGYSLHGTYWHDDFGNRRSHGCVNLPTPIAERLYYWTNPELPDGKRIIRSTSQNPGTRIVIHS